MFGDDTVKERVCHHSLNSSNDGLFIDNESKIRFFLLKENWKISSTKT